MAQLFIYYIYMVLVIIAINLTFSPVAQLFIYLLYLYVSVFTAINLAFLAFFWIIPLLYLQSFSHYSNTLIFSSFFSIIHLLAYIYKVSVIILINLIFRHFVHLPIYFNYMASVIFYKFYFFGILQNYPFIIVKWFQLLLAINLIFFRIFLNYLFIIFSWFFIATNLTSTAFCSLY